MEEAFDLSSIVIINQKDTPSSETHPIANLKLLKYYLKVYSLILKIKKNEIFKLFVYPFIYSFLQ